MCAAGTTAANVQADCWMLTPDKVKCPDAYDGQLINVLRPKDEILNNPLPAGTKVGMQCRTCTDFKTPNTATGVLEDLPGCQ
jgi:hypothetical protein